MVWGLGKDSNALDLDLAFAANHTVANGPGVKERQ